MPRSLSTKKVGLKVRIPEELHGKVTLLLLDPLRGQVKYGGWTGLMTHLLENWCNEQIRIQKRNGNLPIEITDAEKLARAVILFHNSGPWDAHKQEMWRAYTGVDLATTRTLCDLARKVRSQEEHKDVQ